MALILSFGLALANTVVLSKIYFSFIVSTSSLSNTLLRAGPVKQSWILGSFSLAIIKSRSLSASKASCCTDSTAAIFKTLRLPG